MKHFTKLFTLLFMAAMSMRVWAVSLPMDLGSYMPAADAVLSEGNILTSGTYGFGDIHSGATATFTLSNCEENMLLTFMTGTNENRTPQVTVTMTDGGSFNYTTGAIDITRTGGYSLSTRHNYAISNIPSGTITLTFSFSAGGGYVCNLGNIGLYGASQYDQIPGETALDIEHGTHGGNGTPRWHEGTKIAYIYNGGYSIYNVYANPSAYSNPEKIYLNMKMDVVSFNHVGQFQISIYDVNDLTTPECQQTFDITKKANDQVFAFTNPITLGFKQIRFDYILGGDTYMCDYNNLRFAERDDEAGDDPSAVTFGLTRTVAAETSTAPDSKEKYLVAAESLIDPSVVSVTLTKDYTHTPQAMSAPAYLNWVDGGVTKECYTEDRSFRTTTNVLDENSYFGISMSIAIGKKVSFKRVISDALRENNMGVTSLHYQIRIYNNGNWIYSLSEVVSTDANLKRSVDVSHVAALQDLTGSVLIKMCVWNDVEPHYARYIDVKDLQVKAIVEDNDAEGENTLSFVSFDGAREPEFTNGSITARWKRGDGYNVDPSSDSRGIRMTENMTMTLSVPSGSYISEVVFINNGQGNPNAEGNSFNLTITNAAGKTVDNFAESKSGDAHTWSCGVVRESQLTFTQGTGDFYCNSIRVTYRDKSGLSNYTRTHPHDNLNTLCYPYRVDYYTGATFYTMLYKVEEASVVTDVYLQEHVGALEAGKPYFYVPEGEELVCYYSGAREDTPAEVNGVKGFYGDGELTTIPSGSYVAYNNLLTVVGENVRMGEYRAYVVMDDVAEKDDPDAPALVPGRRLLNIGEHKTPTGVENTSAAAIYGGSQKILRNGQLFIIRDGKTYDIFGRLVD